MIGNLPWDGIKIGFGFNDDPDIIWNATAAKAVTWPEGWQYSGSDSSGARCVVIFDVEGKPSEADGLAVRMTLDMLQECGEGEVAARDLKPGDCLDLDGDQYADERLQPGADPDAPSELEYELAAVEGIKVEGPAIVVYTDKVNFACPPDHKVKRTKVDFQLRKELTED
jgi:hypothetical protein